MLKTPMDRSCIQTMKVPYGLPFLENMIDPDGRSYVQTMKDPHDGAMCKKTERSR